MGDTRSIAFDALAKRRVNMRRRVSALIIDDDADTRELLAAVLEQAGYSVATASNGLEGLTLLTSLRPDMILLDIQMPVMDGALFRQAQRRDPELVTIPTAVMTGSNEEPTLDVAVIATLVKPFRRRELLSLVERYCDLSD